MAVQSINQKNKRGSMCLRDSLPVQVSCIAFCLRVCGLAAHCLIPQVAHFWNPLYSGLYYRLLYDSHWH